MRTVIHLKSDSEADCQHAMRSAALLSDHEDLSHEAVVLLAHREGVRLVTPDSG